MRSRLAVAVFPALLAGPLFAADWVSFRANDPNVTFYVDRASVKVSGPTVSFWETMMFDKPNRKDEVSGRLIKEKRVYRVMNCRSRTQGYRYGAIYGENGKLIESVLVDETKVEMAPIVEGSVAEGEHRMVCETVAGDSR